MTNKLVTWTGGPAVALNYGYDPLGSLTNLWSSTANGVTNAYRYDLLGRLTNVLAGAASAASYGYDVVGNLQTLRYANGVTNLYQYDSRTAKHPAHLVLLSRLTKRGQSGLSP